MEDFYIYFVERFGHGQHEKNSLPDCKKVTIENDDGWLFVYECDSDSMADEIATWFVTHCHTYQEIVKYDARRFCVEESESLKKFYCGE
jgi:hypothetical protein